MYKTRALYPAGQTFSTWDSPLAFIQYSTIFPIWHLTTSEHSHWVFNLSITPLFLIFGIVLKLTILCLVLVLVSSLSVCPGFFRPGPVFVPARSLLHSHLLGFVAPFPCFSWIRQVSTPYDTLELETIYWWFDLCVWGLPLHRSLHRHYFKWCKYLFFHFLEYF